MLERVDIYAIAILSVRVDQLKKWKLLNNSSYKICKLFL